METCQQPRGASDFRVTCFSLGKSSPAHLNDISREGCSLSTEEDILADGQMVRLQMDRLTRIEGRVIWRVGLEAGIAFAAPLHAAVVEFIAAQAHAEAKVDMVLRDGFGRAMPRSAEIRGRPSPRGLIDPAMPPKP